VSHNFRQYRFPFKSTCNFIRFRRAPEPTLTILLANSTPIVWLLSAFHSSRINLWRRQDLKSAADFAFELLSTTTGPNEDKFHKVIVHRAQGHFLIITTSVDIRSGHPRMRCRRRSRLGRKGRKCIYTKSWVGRSRRIRSWSCHVWHLSAGRSLDQGEKRLVYWVQGSLRMRMSSWRGFLFARRNWLRAVWDGRAVPGAWIRVHFLPFGMLSLVMKWLFDTRNWPNVVIYSTVNN